MIRTLVVLALVAAAAAGLADPLAGVKSAVPSSSGGTSAVPTLAAANVVPTGIVGNALGGGLSTVLKGLSDVLCGVVTVVGGVLEVVAGLLGGIWAAVSPADMTKAAQIVTCGQPFDTSSSGLLGTLIGSVWSTVAPKGGSCKDAVAANNQVDCVGTVQIVSGCDADRIRLLQAVLSGYASTLNSSNPAGLSLYQISSVAVPGQANNYIVTYRLYGLTGLVADVVGAVVALVDSILGVSPPAGIISLQQPNCSSQSQGQKSGFTTVTSNQPSSISCPADNLIHITYARWVSNNCNTDATEVYRQVCENRNGCNVNNAQYPASAGCHVNSTPNLQYGFVCRPSNGSPLVKQVQQGQDAEISCPAGQQIYIVDAMYASKSGTCSYSVHPNVVGPCNYQQSCQLNPAKTPLAGKVPVDYSTYDTFYGTDCPGTNDRVLTVSYKCINPPAVPILTVWNVQNKAAGISDTTVTCPDNQQVYIRKASHGYGKFVDDTTVVWQAICGQQASNKCTYNSWVPDFDDRDNNRDWDVIFYSCIARQNNPTRYVYVGDNSNIAIKCATPSDIIDIYHAYYGGGDYQADLSVYVKALCQSRNNCSFVANSTVFNNPVFDWNGYNVKHTNIAYKCRAPRYDDASYIIIPKDDIGVIDCHGQHINIVEAFMGNGYVQQDVTSHRVFDRCEADWSDTIPAVNDYCLIGAHELTFGFVRDLPTATRPEQSLTVGYFCSAGANFNVDRRKRQHLFGAGVNRASTYNLPMGNYADRTLNEMYPASE